METYAHGILTYFILRRRESFAAKAALFSIFPDVPYFAAFLSTWGKASLANRDALREGLTSHLANMTHSVTVVTLVAVLILTTKRKNLYPMLIGWPLHVITDLMTHVDDAYPAFWPLWDKKFHSLISYWDPKYHGQTFSYLNHALVLMLLLYIFMEKMRQAYLHRRSGVGMKAE